MSILERMKEMASRQQEQTALGRPIDPFNYRSNLIFLIVMPTVGVLMGLYTLFTVGFFEAIEAGFWVSASAAVAWIVGRELDPDNDYSAFVALALAVIAVVFRYADFQDTPLLTFLLTAGVAIQYLRIVAHPVGPKPYTTDSFIMLAVSLLLLLTQNWIFALAGVLAFALDAYLPANRSPRHYAFAGVLAVATIVRGIIAAGGSVGLTAPYLISLIAIAFVTIVTMVGITKVVCKTDDGEHDFDVNRVRATHAILLFGIFVTALWNGDNGVIWTLPLSMTLLGVALYRLPTTFRVLQGFANNGEAE